MSYYDDDRPPRRHRSRRSRPTDEYSEETYTETRGGGGDRDGRRNMELVRSRRDDSVSSVEEIDRDFPPGGGYIKRNTTVREGVRRTRSVGRDRDRDRYSDYDSRRSDDYAASKASKKSRRYDDDRSVRSRGDRRSRRYDSESESPSRSPPKRRKSMGEQALAALGIGGAAGGLAGILGGKKDGGDSRSRSQSRARSRSRRGGRRDYSSSRSRSRGGKGGNSAQDKIGQAVKAALAAGAAEAFRARKDPGGWSGEKGKRILTAAISAGGVDTILNKDSDKHGKRHVIESAIAGLATNRLVNGARSKSRGPGDRSGSPGRSAGGGGGIKDLAAGGAIAAAGKALYDRARSKSRGRGRAISSSSSYDSRSPPRNRGGNKKRSQSVSDYMAKGLAAVGLKDAADKVDGGNKRHSRRDYSSSEDDDYRQGRGGYADNRDVGGPRNGQVGAAGTTRGPNPNTKKGSGSNSSSDSDLGSSTGEERERKKVRGKEMLTAGLATVATIHAAHNVYQSMEARNERHKAVTEGEISPEEAKKEKNKARLKDAASIGIAALGIKSAVTEWKEVKEKRHEAHEYQEKAARRKEKRAQRRREAEQRGNEPPLGPAHPAGQYAAAGPYVPVAYGGYPANDRYRRSEPSLNSYGTGGPTYYDDNPYGAGANLPPPPPGAPPAARY